MLATAEGLTLWIKKRRQIWTIARLRKLEGIRQLPPAEMELRLRREIETPPPADAPPAVGKTQKTPPRGIDDLPPKFEAPITLARRDVNAIVEFDSGVDKALWLLAKGRLPRKARGARTSPRRELEQWLKTRGVAPREFRALGEEIDGEVELLAAREAEILRRETAEPEARKFDDPARAEKIPPRAPKADKFPRVIRVQAGAGRGDDSLAAALERATIETFAADARGAAADSDAAAAVAREAAWNRQGRAQARAETQTSNAAKPPDAVAQKTRLESARATAAAAKKNLREKARAADAAKDDPALQAAALEARDESARARGALENAIEESGVYDPPPITERFGLDSDSDIFLDSIPLDDDGIEAILRGEPPPLSSLPPRADPPRANTKRLLARDKNSVGDAITFREGLPPWRLINGSLSPDDVVADPAAMQIRPDFNAETGEAKTLSGVQKFDRDAAKGMLFWITKKGKIVVVDGHNRRAKAMDLLAAAREAGDDEAASRVLFDGGYAIFEADGWTPAMARALGGAKNLQGNPVTRGDGVFLAARLYNEAQSNAKIAEVVSSYDGFWPRHKWRGIDVIGAGRAIARLSEPVVRKMFAARDALDPRTMEKFARAFVDSGEDIQLEAFRKLESMRLVGADKVDAAIRLLRSAMFEQSGANLFGDVVDVADTVATQATIAERFVRYFASWAADAGGEIKSGGRKTDRGISETAMSPDDLELVRRSAGDLREYAKNLIGRVNPFNAKIREIARRVFDDAGGENVERAAALPRELAGEGDAKIVIDDELMSAFKESIADTAGAMRRLTEFERAVGAGEAADVGDEILSMAAAGKPQGTRTKDASMAAGKKIRAIVAPIAKKWGVNVEIVDDLTARLGMQGRGVRVAGHYQRGAKVPDRYTEEQSIQLDSSLRPDELIPVMTHEQVEYLIQSGVVPKKFVDAMSAAGEKLAKTDKAVAARLDLYPPSVRPRESAAIFAEKWAAGEGRGLIEGGVSGPSDKIGKIIDLMKAIRDAIMAAFGNNAVRARQWLRAAAAQDMHGAVVGGSLTKKKGAEVYTRDHGFWIFAMKPEAATRATDAAIDDEIMSLGARESDDGAGGVAIYAGDEVIGNAPDSARAKKAAAAAMRDYGESGETDGLRVAASELGGLATCIVGGAK